MERQREYLMAYLRCDRIARRLRSSERRLLRNRHRVVNQRLDAAGGQMRLQCPPRTIVRLTSVAVATHTDDEQMIDVAGIELRNRFHQSAAEPQAIAGGERSPSSCPYGEPRQPLP